MRWIRGVRDGVALVRLAVKKSPVKSTPETFYLDPYYAGSNIFKRETASIPLFGTIGCLLLILLVMLLPFYPILLRDEQRDAALNAGGQEINAIVTDCGKSKQGYWLSYTYTVQGNTYSGGGSSWVCYEPGAAISVWYLPDRPGVSRSSTSGSGAMPDTLPFLQITRCAFVAFAGVLLYALFRYIRNVRRFRRLRRYGIRLAGTFISAPNPRLFQPPLNIRYEFTTPDGQTMTGEQELWETPDRFPAPGTPVHILYADAKTYVML